MLVILLLRRNLIMSLNFKTFIVLYGLLTGILLYLSYVTLGIVISYLAAFISGGVYSYISFHYFGAKRDITFLNYSLIFILIQSFVIIFGLSIF